MTLQNISTSNLTGFRWSLVLSLLLLFGAAKAQYAPNPVEEIGQYKHVGVQTPLTWGEPVDINRAGASALESLPGIGPSTAKKIVSERQLFGEYQSIFRLTRASGVGEKTMHTVAPLVSVQNPRPLPVIDLNLASKRQLQRLPGVGPVLAKRIYDARPFQSFRALQDVRGIGPKTLAKWIKAGVKVNASDAPSRLHVQTP